MPLPILAAVAVSLVQSAVVSGLQDLERQRRRNKEIERTSAATAGHPHEPGTVNFWCHHCEDSGVLERQHNAAHSSAPNRNCSRCWPDHYLWN